MTKKKLALVIFIAIIVVGIVGHFVLNKKPITLRTTTSPYDKVFQAKPQPIAVMPVKKEVSKSALIPEKGGTLTLKDQLQDITLTLPEGALLSPEEISIQSLQTINQLPEGSRLSLV